LFRLQLGIEIELGNESAINPKDAFRLSKKTGKIRSGDQELFDV
jgi:hypothetical protein